MTALTVSQILGRLADPHELALLAAADERAEAFLAAGGGVAMSDSSQHFDHVEASAEQVDGDTITKNRQLLEEFAEEFGGLSLTGAAAEDVACDRWTPLVSAAYYFGLCVGLRLARDEGGRR